MSPAEQELEELSRFVDQCPTGIVRIAKDGRVESMNPAALRLLPPLTEIEESSTLYPLLERVDPGLLALLDHGPDTAGPLASGRRIPIPGPGAADDPHYVELTAARAPSGAVMVSITDVTRECRLEQRASELRPELDHTLAPQGWIGTSADATGRLLDGAISDPMAVVAATVTELVDAHLVTVSMADRDGQLRVVAASGPAAEDLLGVVFPVTGVIDGAADDIGVFDHLAVSSPTSRASSSWDPAIGPLLTVAWGSQGVLVAARRADQAPFDRNDVQTLAVFAGHASVALSLAAEQAERTHHAVVEERERIARVLHEEVIQALFGTALTLEACTESLATATVRDRIGTAGNMIRTIISRLGTTVLDAEDRLPTTTGDGPRRMMTDHPRSGG